MNIEDRLDKIEQSLIRLETHFENHLSHHQNDLKAYLQVRIPLYLTLLQLSGYLLAYYLLK